MEIEILNFIQENLRNSLLDQFFIFITNLGNIGYIYYILTAILLLKKETRKTGIILIIAMLINLVITNLTLKPLIKRPRPFVINPAIELMINAPKSYSFPSGHTAQGFTVAFSLLLNKNKLAFPFIIFASIMAFTRLYCYVHYPTDILGGIFVGFIASYISTKIVQKITTKNI